MKRYPISEYGAQQIELLADKITKNGVRIEDAGERLKQQIDSETELGEYRNKILCMVEVISSRQKAANEMLHDITKNVLAVADKIRRLVSMRDGDVGCDGSHKYDDDSFDAVDIDDTKSGGIKKSLNIISENLKEILDRHTIMAGSESRKLILPRETSSGDEIRGKWIEDVFFFDDNYVPAKFNDSRLCMSEIKAMLKKEYNIDFKGIPYIKGVVDFSSISIAAIDVDDIVTRALGLSKDEFLKKSQMEKTKLYMLCFSKSKRNINFEIADRVLAERQVDIPGLEKGYTWTQLSEWRSKNHFTWDEQLGTGYSLVPSVIHGNLAHTGLVSISGNAYTNVKNRFDDLKKNPKLYCVPESEAVITIDDLIRQSKK